MGQVFWRKLHAGVPVFGRLARAAVRLVSFALVSVALVIASAPAVASAAGHAAPAYSNGKLYRHGVVPFKGHQHTKAVNPATTSGTSANNLNYGGGISGVGVTTGPPKVYLVFWGSQWGTQGTNSSGNATFSGDPKGVAPDLEAFFEGVGSAGDAWSGVMTQYCQGVPAGSQSCPTSNGQHVGYPTGGAFAGVWEDRSASAPRAASGNQLGAEAVKAANHFGNSTGTSNRNTQYVIVSPTGTDPDYYKYNGFCAWHDYTGDSTLSGGGAVNAPNGPLAFTNLPYLPDAGASCGQGFVNSPGTLDGVTIVEGHEYAETITDQFPAGGYTDSSGNENGDKCAWISSGQGASQNITLTTGSFAVQSTWANDYNGGSGGCEVSHPVVTNGAGSTNTVTVTNPGNQTGNTGQSVSLQIIAKDSASGQTLTYSASGLPAGLSINPSSGLISGTPTTASTGSVTVTATDTGGASGSTTFSWTVNTPAGSCTPTQLLGNPGFETGSASPWSATAGVVSANGSGEAAHSGSWFAWLDGYGSSHTDTLSQAVTIPSNCTNTTFSFWLHIDTAETTTTTAYDTLKVQVLNSSGTVLATLATYSNLNAAAGYTQRSVSLAAYAGQTVTLKFTGIEDASLQTSFVIDDTAVNTG